MSPPSATIEPFETGALIPTKTHSEASILMNEPGLSKEQAQAPAAGLRSPFRTPFEDKYAEREYQKGRLVLAFRIFAKLGYDEGVAGHITLRVSGWERTFTNLGFGWLSNPVLM